MWTEIDGTDIKKLSADMRLSDVKAQLGEGLPELDLVRLQGRAGWQKVLHDDNREGDIWYIRQLHYMKRGERGLEPVNFSLQLMEAHAGKPGAGKVNASGLNLEILGDLVDYLPISPALREEVSRASPRGDIQSLWAQWSGEWMTPVVFNVRGSFANVSMRQTKKLPSFSGITGNIDATEKGGTLNLSSRHAKVELSDVFREPVTLDMLTGQASWSLLSGISLKLSNISFSNRFTAGMAHGTYDLKPDGVDTIDLVGQLTNADAAYLVRHMPGLGGLSADELQNLIVEGRLSDVRLHLKGNLNGVPSAKQDSAIFRVQAKASGVTLHNLSGWPNIENISGNLLLHGNRIEFDATQANISGIKVSKARLQIADMTSADAAVTGHAEASGATQQFVNIATQYSENIGGVLPDSVRFTGEGRLWLNFGVPISSGAAKFAGTYQLIDNQLDPGSRMPSLESINGMLGFSNSGIKIQNVIARLLGGPVFINAASTQDGSFHLAASGTLNLGNVNETAEWKTAEVAPFLRHLQGSTAWRAAVHKGDKATAVTVESSLHGLSSNLPEPFSKSSTESIPFRFERTTGGPNKDEVNINYGGRASARIIRTRAETGEYKAERGTVVFGATSTALPVKGGIAVTGTLPFLDLDRWLAQLKQLKPQNHAEAGFSTGLSAVSIQLGALTFLGRRLTDVTLNASKEDGAWRSAIAGKEINGNINWNPSGKGRVVARLNKLIVPSASQIPGLPMWQLEKEKDPPALDVLVEDFSIGEKHFGQLELLANHQEQNWRIEKLHITTPDSSVLVRGSWDKYDRRASGPLVKATLTLESNDIGKLLTRLGHPERIERGKGQLEGTFSWRGQPQSIDYATLSGSFKINAKQGQFPKFEPGIGRLFGIFDLKTLPRRIVLDFHDVFSEGFAFNDISGDIKVNHGIATTDDLRIEGPAARVTMTGRINLEAETQDLHMKVDPSFGLATPVVGVASMIVSKALRKPTAPNEYNITEYDITGEWADPVVTKTSGHAASLEKHD